jgi:hypothetical protein
MKAMKAIATGLLSLLAFQGANAQERVIIRRQGPVVQKRVIVTRQPGYYPAHRYRQPYPYVYPNTQVVVPRSYGGYRSYYYDNGMHRYYHNHNGRRVYYYKGWVPPR